jgi:hypothetical protein
MAVTAPAPRAGFRRWASLAAWALWALAILGLGGVAGLDRLLRQAGRPDLTVLNPDGVPYLLAAVSSATVGAVLASRRPRHPVGWLLLALGLTVSVEAVADGYGNYGVQARPGAVPAAGLVALYNPATLAILLACIGFVLLLTPTGSLPSPRWRWWARVAAAAPVVFVAAMLLLPEPLDQTAEGVHSPLAVPALGAIMLVVNQLALAVVALAVPVAGGSLVLRFRRARGTERQQLRWVAVAAGLVALMAVAVPIALLLGNLSLFEWALGLCVALLPLAIGAAILRYRLYDLDRIISRTLSYAVLTVLLGGGYAVIVLTFGQLLGRHSSLVVAGATLAVAAAFQPARRRVQQAVDRRFNRRRYDAARTIAAFSARLRQQVDLESLTAELLDVVDQTVQPTSASLWLRDPVGARVAR